jgi:hypothetical protein
MQGTIAQLVALTIHGNAILQKRQTAERSNLQATNTTFQFCEWVKFTDALPAKSLPELLPYALDVQTWFERLSSEGAYAIRMSYGPSQTNSTNAPDRSLVAFVGGGGEWRIQTYRPESTDVWRSNWQVGDRTRTDKKIWRVSYVRVFTSPETQWPQGEDLELLKSELKTLLVDIAQFSREQHFDSFTACFESALACLDSETPLQGVYHKDLAPSGFLSLTANQLLCSAQAAWVFGGMGSWNDVYFEDTHKARYNDLSEKLYRLLNRAIVAVANSQPLRP